MSLSTKTKKMKKIKIALIIAVIFTFSCASESYWKLKIEIPAKTTFNLDQYNEVVVTNFLIEEKTKDFDLNKELVDYLSFEIGQNFKGKVSSKKIAFEKEEPFKKESFWKNLLPDQKKALIFTGGANYTEEVRKAILKEKKVRFEEPTVSKTSLAERRFYTLNLNLYIIDAQTGKALYTRNFKESSGYKNPKQTAAFAFFDLIQRVRDKFFRNILAEPSIQERYLISD
jgi:hypothetical protein